jgi:Right handed beta helix region
LSTGSNQITLNRVWDVMQTLNDGAGIYVNGIQPGTKIDHNVVHDVVKTPSHMFDYNIWGIYLDGGSQSFLVRDNLTYRTEYGGIMLNAESSGGLGNEVTNNIFVDGIAYELDLYSAFLDTFHQNIVYDGESSSPTLFAYVAANAIGSSDYNLFFGPGFGSELMTWRQKTGFDAQSILPDLANPLFVDYALDNFALKPGSIAVLPIAGGGIAFQPIDFTGLP